MGGLWGSAASSVTNGKNRKPRRAPEAKSIKQLLTFRPEAQSQPQTAGSEALCDGGGGRYDSHFLLIACQLFSDGPTQSQGSFGGVSGVFSQSVNLIMLITDFPELLLYLLFHYFLHSFPECTLPKVLFSTCVCRNESFCLKM